MKNLLKYVLVLCLLEVFGSCSKVLKVFEATQNAKPKKLKGMPFYLKRQILKQRTKYLYWWYDVTLTRMIKDGEKTKELIVYQSTVSSTEPFVRLESIVKAVGNYNSGATGIAESDIKDEIEKLKRRDEPFATMTLIENSALAESTVDYSKMYYANGVLPWFGSATFTPKLNADGSLSEVSASTENKTGDFIASLLPIKEVLSGLLTPFSAPSSSTAAPVKSPRDLLVIQIRQRGEIATFEQVVCDNNCLGDSNVREKLKPIPYRKDNIHSVESWSDEQAPTKGGTKNSISVSGEIVLPDRDK